jgi:NhaP-type Na+/H+ or K+/H+ antiporter
MAEDKIIILGGIIVLGMGAQWLSWRLKFPSIVFLLLFGFLAGPVTGFLHPEELMGDILTPFVSISVAIILFEGGLSLRIKELKESGGIILRLLTIGLLITWAISSAVAYYILDLHIEVSLLLGAILVVTGPTVIGPLLRHVRPTGKIGNILKWEGIVIDPIGALLAVLVFEALMIGEASGVGTMFVFTIIKTGVVGVLAGFAFAWLLILLIKKFLIPDFLQETTTLSLVIASFVFAEFFQHESGLFAATIMGIVLVNQNIVNIRHIVEFKENLRVLIISFLFIVLSARLNISDFQHFSINSGLFILALIFIGRPASVFFATIKTGLKWREKLFLAWMAPRGIVAAAVSSMFALRLSETDLPQAEMLVPITFFVIVGTVVIYGLTSAPVARWLKVTQHDPQGVLMVGAHSWALELAKALKKNGFRVGIIDTNRQRIQQANMAGIPAYNGSVLSKEIRDSVDMNGIGKLLALTSNDEANSLSVLHFSEVFEREELYQLSPALTNSCSDQAAAPQHLCGRFLFGEHVDFRYLNKRHMEGAMIKSTKLTEEFGFNDFKKMYGQDALPMFLIKDNKLQVFNTDLNVEPKTGSTIIAMVDN